MKAKTDDDPMVREEDAAITAENLKIEAQDKAKAKPEAEKTEQAKRAADQQRREGDAG